jgi:Protein of unknown function (DUF3486)
MSAPDALFEAHAKVEEQTRRLIRDGWSITGIAALLTGLRRQGDDVPGEIWREVVRLLSSGRATISSIVSHLRVLGEPKPKRKLAELEPELKAEVDRLIRDGRATIDEIVVHVRGLGAEVSRSAVHRYKQSAESAMKRYREAQEVAGVWVREFKEQPDGDVGRLLAEMLKSVAFSTLSGMADRADDPAAGGEDAPAAPTPMDLMLMAKAIGELERARKTSFETEQRIRQQVETRTKAAAAAAAEAVAKERGLSTDTVQAIRAQILGVRSA